LSVPAGASLLVFEEIVLAAPSALSVPAGASLLVFEEIVMTLTVPKMLLNFLAVR